MQKRDFQNNIFLNYWRAVFLLLFLLSASNASLPSPQADYQMDACYYNGTAGEVKDSSGNNYNGRAINGATTESNTTADGGICHVGKFDGSDDYVDLGNILNPNSDNWSISVWVKWNGSSGDNIIYNKENLYEAKIAGGKFYYAWKPHWYWDGGIEVSANEWTHFVVTYDHHQQKVYKNGELVYQRDQTGDIGTNSDKLLVGARGNDNPKSFFGGDIDELEIYDTALDANQTKEIYDNEKAKKNYDGSERVCSHCVEPVLNYQMDACSWKGLTDEVKDSSGNGFDATPMNGVTTESNRTVGGICHVGKFDGANDKIKGDFDYHFDNSVTMTVWINTSTNQKKYARVMEFGSHGGDFHYSTAIAYHSDGRTINAWTTNSSRHRSGVVSFDMAANGYHDGKWHFVAYVYNGTTATLYVDGSQVDQVDTNIGAIDIPDTVSVGGYALDDKRPFNGYIDEAKIFDEGLSSADVYEIYQNEKAKKNYDGSKRVCSCIEPIADYQMDACYWDATTGEVKDSSGNDYNGVAVNGANTELNITAGGGICHVGKFDGVDDYLNMGNILSPGSDDWSISVWIKWNGKSGESIIYNKENLYEAKVSGGKFYYAWRPYWYWMGGIEVSANEWTHFVVTYDHHQQKVYKNGVLVYQRDQTGDIGSNNSNFLIAKRTYHGDDRCFGGEIDELEVYNRALDANKTKEIYDNEKAKKNYDGSERVCSCKVPILNYQMDECFWNGKAGEVKDSSYNSYDATALNGTTTESNSTAGGICHVGKFDGANDKIRGDFDYHFDNNVTITLWMKTSTDQKSYTRVLEFGSHGGDYHYSTAIAYGSKGKIIKAWTSTPDGHRSGVVYYDLSSNGYHDGNWHLISYVYNGYKAKLYVDGDLKYEKKTVISSMATPDTISIGGYAPDGKDYYFKGYIDEVKIFDKELNATDILKIYDNEKAKKNYDGSTRVCSCVEPLADYKMDACYWDGTTGEVKDSSGNDYNGTAINGANTESNTTAGGGICHVGKFDGVDDYLNMGNILSPGSRDWSVGVWVKWNGKSGENIIYNKENLYEAKVEDGSFYYAFKPDWNWEGNISIAKDEWTHFVVTYDHHQQKVYKNGVLVYQRAQTGDIGSNDSLFLVGKRTDHGSETYFGGDIDELEVFGASLSNTQVKKIYDNEKAKKNYDGSDRVCSICLQDVTPIEMEGDRIYLHNTYKDPTWNHVDFKLDFTSTPVVFVVLDSNGSDPATVRIKNVSPTGFDAMIVEPQGEDGPHYSQRVSYLAVNKGIHKLGKHYIQVGTIQTRKVQGTYAPAGNEIGWEKIDSKIKNPAVVSNIQTINNIESNLPNEPLIPWGTSVVNNIDNDGVYLAIDMSETSEGVFSKTETIGYMIGENNTIDSFVTNAGDAIKYEVVKKDSYFVGWDNKDNRCRTTDFLNDFSEIPVIAGWKNSRYDQEGGWFRICHLDKDSIGFVIDEDRSHDRGRYHPAEDGAYFAFSNNFTFTQVEEKPYRFDAFDTFRSLNDRNISTKIVNQEFNLSVVSLNEEGSSYQDFNGTVCADVNGSVVKLYFVDQSSAVATFKISKAIKDTKVSISWKRDVNEDCPLVNEDNRTISSDNFAIRPEKFTILTSQTLFYAGDEFNLSFRAMDFSGNNTLDYNETYNTSFTVESNMTKPGCIQGVLKVGDFTFENGYKADVNTTYSNLGDINITIRENKDSSFASVDKDDTSDMQRLIEPSSIMIYVRPYDLNVTDLQYVNSSGKEWLYDANVSDINTTITATIKAFAKDNPVALADFNSTCYAKDVNVSFFFDTDFADNGIEMDYEGILGILNTQPGIEEINETYITILKDDFVAGEAKASFAYNIQREFNTPYNPINIALKDVNITTQDVSKLVYNSTDNDMNSTYYYGKLFVNDISTNENNISSNLFIDVYCSDCQDGIKEFYQDSLNWYRNGYDGLTKASSVSILPKNDFKLSSDDKDNITISDILDSSEGKIGFKIENSINGNDSAVLHVLMPYWLWNNGYKDYNDSSDSDCSTHPCINYTLSKGSGGDFVNSGTFKGSDIGHEQNSSIKRHGLKVFR